MSVKIFVNVRLLTRFVELPQKQARDSSPLPDIRRAAIPDRIADPGVPV